MKKEEQSSNNTMTRLAIVGAVALAIVLYYVLVLGQYADKVQYIGGR